MLDGLVIAEIKEYKVDFLKDLMSEGQRRREYQDFAQRYDRGAPHDRISDGEATNRYREVARNMPEEEYRLSAREAFERMSPEERKEFGRLLKEHAHGRGHGDFVDRNHDGQDDRFEDPDYLAGMTSRMHQQQPDAMTQLISGMLGGGAGGGSGMSTGGPGGMLSSPVAKAAAAGIAAMAAKRIMRNRP